jgi:hypothetical protein
MSDFSIILVSAKGCGAEKVFALLFVILVIEICLEIGAWNFTHGCLEFVISSPSHFAQDFRF